jgi:hypothetical protein
LEEAGQAVGKPAFDHYMHPAPKLETRATNITKNDTPHHTEGHHIGHSER